MADFFGGVRSAKGANDFLVLSKKLKAAGETGLRRDLNKGLQRAARPLARAAKEEAGAVFPRRGGLNEIMRRRQVVVRTSTGAKTAGVRIVALKIDRRVDELGMIRHPVFGNREKWVSQYVPAAKGYFTNLMREQVPAVRREVLGALRDFTATLKVR